MKTMQMRDVKMCLFLVVFIVSGVCSSCSKSQECLGGSEDKGIIEDVVGIECLPSGNQREYIINDDVTYRLIFTDSVSGELNCNLPDIDFDKHSLLGVYASGQCEVAYIREVTLNNGEQKYHYKVVVKSCGICKKLEFSYNWVIVPKIPVGCDVAFEVKNQ